MNPNPKIAAVDVGSNTLRLLIVEVIPFCHCEEPFPRRRRGQDKLCDEAIPKNEIASPSARNDIMGINYRVLHQEQEITRLGEGLGVGATPCGCPSLGRHGGLPLQDAAMARSLAVLKKFGETARSFGVQKILAVGTRALREANNGKAFARRVKQEAGYPLRIIDPEHEARLALLGVFGALPQLDDILLVDIGGGSTEFTLAGRQGKTNGGAQFIAPQVIWSCSTDLGVVRLLEQFLHHDPPAAEEIIKLSEHVKEKIKGLIPDPSSLTPDPCLLVGTAGTYTTLAALEQEMEIYNPARINGYALSITGLEILEQRLYSLPLKERKQLKGLEPGRADVILPGATLARLINQVLGYERVVVSDGGLREGIVWEWMGRKS